VIAHVQRARRHHAVALLLCLAFIGCRTMPAGEPVPAATSTEETLDESQDRLHPRLFDAQDLGLLDAADRETWQNPDQVMDALKIAEGSVVADVGAAGGWFTIRLARRVEENGLVYAEDIQAVMLEAIRRRAQRENLSGIVRTIHGTPTDPKLPASAIDAAIIVDAYHEMDDPTDPAQIVTLLTNVGRALKPQGCLGVVDFEPGAGGPGPRPHERVKPDTVIKAAEAGGLRLLKKEAVPPFQYLLVFGKAASRSRCAA
jgi:ubiquinone/menaquinone biosynthesis C-methylase UbiE